MSCDPLRTLENRTLLHGIASFPHVHVSRLYPLYLRFDDQGTVQTCHVCTGSEADVKEILRLAQQHGLTLTAHLVESAAFSVGYVKRRRVRADPTQFFEHAGFVARWKAVASTTQAPPAG